MKQAKRIILYELVQWIDYGKIIESTYNNLKASGLPLKYLGKTITKKQIEAVKNKIEALNKKLDRL